jgi:hypothetical protein
MTALVLMYLLHFQKVDLEDGEYTFDIDRFLELSRPMEKKTDVTNAVN